MTKRVPIDRITCSGTQTRVDVSIEHVDELVANLEALPPVTLVHDSERSTHWIVDGYHRVAAHAKAGRKTIEAYVTDGTQEDAVWAACGANASHGLRRTNADKRKAVTLALEHRQALELDMSDRAIAEHCKVSDHLVADVRAQLRVLAVDEPALGVASKPRKGRDGKVRRLPSPPKVPAEAKAVAATAPIRPPPAEDAPQSTDVDVLGKTIPGHLATSWGQLVSRTDTILAGLREARLGVAALKTCAARSPKAMSAQQRDHLHSFGADLDALMVRAEAYRPHVVCGCGGDGCTRCKGRGWLGRAEHEAHERAERRAT